MNITGCTIENNIATNTDAGDGEGGGILLRTEGELHIVSTTIQNNKTSGCNGGGIFLNTDVNAVTLSGEVIISDNDNDTDDNNFYLNANQKITISDTGLSANSNIGITTESVPTSGNPVPVTTANETDQNKKYFTSDNATYKVFSNASNEVMLGIPTSLPETLTTDTYPDFYSIDNTSTIPDGVTVTLTGDISNSTPENFIIEDGGQLITNKEGIKATVEKDINGSMEWYTISSPIKGTVTTESVMNLLTNPYDLFYYDEPTHYWINSRHSTMAWNTMTSGMGYLYSGVFNSRSLGFKGEIAVDDVERNLSNSATALKGFNLIGNPYSHNITLDDIELSSGSLACYYILNNGTWAARTTEAIAPCTGILVQVPAAVIATFNNNVGPAKSRNDMDNIAISISNGQYEDRAYAMFGKGYGLEKIRHLSGEAPMLYISDEGTDYAVAMMNEDIESFALSFKAQTEGSYTIVMKNNGSFDYLHLIDRLTGTDTDMLAGSYTFSGSSADAAERFEVRLAAGISTDSFIFQNGSELVINGEGTLQVIDMLGRVLVDKKVNNGRVSVSSLHAGAYIVRLIGNEVKTQKIIVR